MAHRGKEKMHVTCRSIAFAICVATSSGSNRQAPVHR